MIHTPTTGEMYENSVQYINDLNFRMNTNQRLQNIENSLSPTNCSNFPHSHPSSQPHTCDCDDGYIPTADKKSCVPGSAPYASCSVIPHSHPSSDPSLCDCDTGYVGNGLACVPGSVQQTAPTGLPSDVASNAWYANAVSRFVSAGYLPGYQPFRPNDFATRGEFIDLVVRSVNGSSGFSLTSSGSFTDVPIGSGYYAAFEEAAQKGWVTGANDCYGKQPCPAKPDARVNRAEAAKLIVKAFGFEKTVHSPQFDDNPLGQWYTDVIQTAADHCILQGNGASVRPGDFMTRAEMVVIISRVANNETYPNCTP